MGSDRDYPGPWLSVIPFIPYFDIHSLANNLEDDPSAWLFGGINDAFAPVNAGRQLSRGFPQRLQAKRLFRLIAPRPEHLRMIAAMTVNMMSTIGVATIGRMIGLLMSRPGIELHGSNRPTDSRISKGTLPQLPQPGDNGGTGRLYALIRSMCSRVTRSTLLRMSMSANATGEQLHHFRHEYLLRVHDT
jgi:hypothetical protein